MRRSRHFPAGSPIDEDPLGAVAAVALALLLGVLAGGLVQWVLLHCAPLRRHDPFETRLLGPLALGALVTGLVTTALRPRTSVWSVSGPAAAAGGGLSAARLARAPWVGPEVALLVALIAIGTIVAGLACAAGWMDRRRAAGRSTWRRGLALALACVLGTLSVTPYAVVALVAPGFDLTVRLGERQLAVAYAPPLGITWAVAAVLVAAATRLPHPVLALAGVAALVSAASALVGSSTLASGAAVPGAAGRAAVWVILTGLLLQAAYELRETDDGGPLGHSSASRRRRGWKRPRR